MAPTITTTSHADPDASAASQVGLARRVCELSRERWGAGRETMVIGTNPTLVAALERATRFAEADGPVLITGETGTGKELFASSVYLCSRRSRRPFLSVNCAQFHDGQLLATELFGHRKGSFTGATGDHRGVFEEADGGTVFLDEIGELAVPAQAMLLRVLSEGEIVPVGATHAKRVDVRVIAATSRDLRAMVASGRFREDLYYRLRHLHLRVPPLRERGDDWRLVLEHYLARTVRQQTSRKMFSRHALSMLAGYEWPGNVRELRSLVDTGYHMSEGPLIEAEHFMESLEQRSRDDQLRAVPFFVEPSTMPSASPAAYASASAPVSAPAAVPGCYERMVAGAGDFWQLVHRPYMDRELSRAEVRVIVERGLVSTRGSYKRLLGVFGVADADYLKFMDFLRHHDLKPRS